MEIGIIGLPQSGKTTTFNSLIRGSAATGAHGRGGQSNIGVAHVGDPRIDILNRMYNPRKLVPAEVRYIDIPGQPPGLGKSEGIRGEYLLQVSQVDALLHVVRAFQNEAVPHIETTIDPARDIGLMEMEIAFADLAIIERRLNRMKAEMKGARGADIERGHQVEAMMLRFKEALETETPLRDLTLTAEEQKIAADYQFLTAKPLLTLLNIGENDLETIDALVEKTENEFGAPQKSFTYLPAQLEEELAQLDEEEAREFRTSMGLDEQGLERVTQKSQALLGQISFFTVGEDEVRAWNVTEGIPAQQAAGKIHSDIERGFIRAEVVHYDNLVECGSEAVARQRGLLRQEGKTYTVLDGDVINFLFNV